MDMSKFNQGNLFEIDAYDSLCFGCAIGHNKAKFRFCLGEMNHVREEGLKCLFSAELNHVVVDLYLYGIKNLKIKFLSIVQMRYTTVVDFNEINGDLLIRLQEDTGSIIEFLIGYDSYKWEYVREYPYRTLTLEEEDKLAKDVISTAEEYREIVWND